MGGVRKAGRPRCYVLVGQTPVEEPDLLAWAKWYGELDHRVVSQTEIGTKLVSTVFLGIDHQFRFDGPPILFETMVFGPKEEKELLGRMRPVREEEYCERCSTWLEAEAMHQRAIKWAKEHMYESRRSG